MHSLLKSLSIIWITLTISNFSNACTGGSFYGNLSPSNSYQTQSVRDGRYYTVDVQCGRTYDFTFCSNGGSNGTLYPEITILNSTGSSQLAFAGFTSGCAQIMWVANFTGTIRVLITDAGCGSSSSYQGTMAYRRGGQTSPTFYMDAVCNGVITTITGTPGGTFSWNPSNPGDGSILNTTTGNITNGVDGATYSLRYTSACGTSTIQSATLPAYVGGCWTLNGTATDINVSGRDCIELTSAKNSQGGCAWSGTQIDFASSFTLSLEYYFGASVLGADGSTFTFQSSSSTACGMNGKHMGAGGLSNAVSIEFDTYDNDFPMHVYDMLADHIAIEIDGNHANGTPFCGPVSAKPSGANIDDGNTYPVMIQWNAPMQQLRVYFNGALRLTCSYDFVTNVFGGNSRVYWGATASTGALNNQQYFCPETVIILPTEMSRFEANCDGENHVFQWETLSERDLDYFVIEKTTDGITFYPVGEVKAVGTSNETNEYSLVTSMESNSYYRIRAVDTDGSFETSELIKGSICSVEASLISSFSVSQDLIHAELTEPSTFSLYNQMGQIVYNSGELLSDRSLRVAFLPSGMYFARFTTVNGNMEVKKFVIAKN